VSSRTQTIQQSTDRGKGSSQDAGEGDSRPSSASSGETSVGGEGRGSRQESPGKVEVKPPGCGHLERNSALAEVGNKEVTGTQRRSRQALRGINSGEQVTSRCG